MADAIAGRFAEVEVHVVPIRTAGDERPAQVGGPARGSGAADKSRFVKEIEEALLRREFDLAVHSAKDVPGDLPAGLRIVGVPARADPSDALCGAGSLEELPEGASVGTSSLRRRAQLLARRPDLDIRELHGNVDTRLRRLEDGHYAGVVLATAGLARLGLSPGAALSTEVMTPAPGQGCLALEARADDERSAELADALIDRGSLLRLTAERALTSAIGASCRTPVGAHAVLDDGRLRLSAFVGMPDGSAWIRDSLVGDRDAPAPLGRAVAERLLAAGAREMLAGSE